MQTISKLSPKAEAALQAIRDAGGPVIPSDLGIHHKVVWKLWKLGLIERVTNENGGHVGHHQAT
jgi:hypothetical protein